MRHGQGNDAVCSRIYRDPLLALSRGVGEAHIERHQFGAVVHPPFDDPLGEGDILLVVLVGIGPEIQDEARFRGVVYQGSAPQVRLCPRARLSFGKLLSLKTTGQPKAFKKSRTKSFVTRAVSLSTRQRVGFPLCRSGDNRLAISSRACSQVIRVHRPSPRPGSFQGESSRSGS